MDKFYNLFMNFLKHQSDSCIDANRVTEIHEKDLHLRPEDERKSYEFGMTWGWVINDGWTNPLMKHSNSTDDLCYVPDFVAPLIKHSSLHIAWWIEA